MKDMKRDRKESKVKKTDQNETTTTKNDSDVSQKDLTRDTSAKAEEMSEDQLHAETEKAEAAYEAEVADLKEKLMRTLADAENLRKRSVREKEETARYAIQKFAADLLQVSDNLERAIAEFEKVDAQHSPETLNLLEGVKITDKELAQVFNRHGLEKVSPLGEKFDHNFHEAMFEAESDEHKSGTVMQVVQPGYTLNGRLVRPARVGVAK